MFQKTAASFDECSTAGVFLSTLHCQDYRSELLFPSDMQTLSSGEPLELPDLGFVDMTDLKGELSQPLSGLLVTAMFLLVIHRAIFKSLLNTEHFTGGSSGKPHWVFSGSAW